MTYKRSQLICTYTLVFLVSSACWGNGFARANRISALRELSAVKTETPPLIDGKLTDACWKRAARTTGFTQLAPARGAKATEQTIVYVLQDEQKIYFAFDCRESHPDSIVADSRRRDNVWRDDQVQIFLDTYHDHRTYYVFTVNPLGTQLDQMVGPGGNDFSWDAQWESKGSINSEGWTVEVAIPFSTLRFEPKLDTWGINFYREEKRRDERSFWAYYEGEKSWDARNFGHLTGLSLKKQSLKLNIQGALTNKADLGNGSLFNPRGGLDVKLKPTANLVADFTLFPDFAEVEVDPESIELMEFERYLEERRPFFKEQAELFNTPQPLYYSRRIWDISAGAKLTGRVGNYTIGLLDAEASGERENYQVLRMRRDFGKASNIGILYTGREKHENHNRMLSFDSTLKPTQNLKMILQLAKSDTEKKDEANLLLLSGMEYNRNPLRMQLTYGDIRAHFNPGLAYLPLKDIKGFGWGWRYQLQKGEKEAFYRRISLETGFQRFVDHVEGQLQFRFLDLSPQIQFHNKLTIWGRFENMYYKPNKNSSIEVGIRSGWLRMPGGMSLKAGIFRGSRFQTLSFGLNPRITDRFRMRISSDNTRQTLTEGDSFLTHLHHLSLGYDLGKTMWIKTSFYTNDFKRYRINFIFGRQVGIANYLYIVYKGQNTREGINRLAFVKVVLPIW